MEKSPIAVIISNISSVVDHLAVSLSPVLSSKTDTGFNNSLYVIVSLLHQFAVFLHTGDDGIHLDLLGSSQDSQHVVVLLE